ncbi:MAG: N-acetyltransferase [Alphaproteobacteria bacterium]|nr:MAG: N-acetyltransferase [Alphaproteobacteria bacterium]
MQVLMAEQADRPQVIQVYREGWLASVSSRMREIAGPFLEQIDYAARWPQELQTSNWRTYKIVDGDKIVGVGVAEIRGHNTPDPYGHFKYFYILPGYKGKGSAKAMLVKACDWLIENNITRMDDGLIVSDPNKAQWMDFWVRHGAVLKSCNVETTAYVINGEKLLLRLIGVCVPNLHEFRARLRGELPQCFSALKDIEAIIYSDTAYRGWENLGAILRQYEAAASR